jgi:hypothetical protein
MEEWKNLQELNNKKDRRVLLKNLNTAAEWTELLSRLHYVHPWSSPNEPEGISPVLLRDEEEGLPVALSHLKRRAPAVATKGS